VNDAGWRELFRSNKKQRQMMNYFKLIMTRTGWGKRREENGELFQRNDRGKGEELLEKHKEGEGWGSNSV
jgi:hypothetical protein